MIKYQRLRAFACIVKIDLIIKWTAFTMNLNDVIEPIVNGMGYELVDLEIKNNSKLIRVFIDFIEPSKELTPEGYPKGVGIEDCVNVTHQLQRVFDVEEIDYDRFEVSSPGLDRPIKKMKDYLANVGKKIQVKTKMPLENRKNFIGVLKSVDESELKISLEVEKETFEIEIINIDKTRLIPVFKF